MNNQSFAYWSIGMGIFLMLASAALLFFPPPYFIEHPELHKPIAIVFFLYGGFRLYRAAKTLREKN